MKLKETIPAVVEDGYISFVTTHLSQYGIIATKNNTAAQDKNTVITPNGNNSTNTSTENKKTDKIVKDTPKTGDNTNLVLVIGTLVISAFVCMSLKKKKEM